MSQSARILERLRDQVRGFAENVFVREVGVLAGGTGLAQAVMVAALPVLTRLYTPDDFNVLATYVAIVAIFSAAACLRLDAAIPVPDDDDDAANLLTLALLLSFAVSAAVSITVWLFSEEILSALGGATTSAALWLIPIGIWLASSYSALQYWATRKKRFSQIASTRLTQSAGGIVAQIALGLAGIGSLGLLVGHAVSGGAGSGKLALSALKNDSGSIRAVSISAMRNLFLEYRRFPKYSTLEVLANSAGVQIPIILIAAIMVGPEAGFLMLAMRVMQVPMSLIGTSIAQVFYSRAADEYRRGSLGLYTADTLEKLFKAGVGPILFVGTLAPVLFEVLFGSEWARAGQLVRWMLPWIAFQFISSPLSMVMHVVERQREMMWLTIGGFVLRLGPVLLAAYFLGRGLAEAYAAGSAAFYLLLGLVICARSGCSRAQLAGILRRNIATLIAWMVVGLSILSIVNWLVK